MSTPSYHAAVDLGAESGRVMVGRLDADKIHLEEVHRFSNGPLEVSGTLRWDLPRILREAAAGLRQAAGMGLTLTSVSADSWGVDYAWLADDPGLPYHYRDPGRNQGALADAFQAVPADDIYAATGIQFLSFNTLYQLRHDLSGRPGLVHAPGQVFLNIADLLNFKFSGVKAAEETLASTTQCFDPWKHDWAFGLLDRFGLPRSVFPPVVKAGTVLGSLDPGLNQGLAQAAPGCAVVAGCSHDTASAVVAVPALGRDWAFLSSGTWSLLGAELDRPLATPLARSLNFTNEAGYGGTTRLLKNIVGLFVLQECRRQWKEQGSVYSYDDLAELAGAADPLASLIDPADPLFSQPGGMADKVKSYCRDHGQPVPREPGQVARCVLESLALQYRHTLAELESLTGRRFSTLHIVGGGSRNALLNQFAADATGREVWAGPAEATAAGNVLVQGMALGRVAGLEAARKLVRNSFELHPYRPQTGQSWDAAYKVFLGFKA